MPTKMESEEELAIGSKIRELRQKQRLTLQDSPPGPAFRCRSSLRWKTDT